MNDRRSRGHPPGPPYGGHVRPPLLCEAFFPSTAGIPITPLPFPDSSIPLAPRLQYGGKVGLFRLHPIPNRHNNVSIDKIPNAVINSIHYHQGTARGRTCLRTPYFVLTAAGIDVSNYPTDAELTTYKGRDRSGSEPYRN
jgi:hypothetical protein